MEGLVLPDSIRAKRAVMSARVAMIEAFMTVKIAVMTRFVEL